MAHTPRHDIAVALCKLQSGQNAEAYFLAVTVLHRVGGTLSDESRSCWDSASAVAARAAFTR
jgi:hypothetical protein